MDSIVITGLGAITPIGNDVETFWQNLTAGVSGADALCHEGLEDSPVKIACEVKGFDAAAYMSHKRARLTARSSQLALAASRQAAADAGLDGSAGVAPERIGVVINTGGGGIAEVETGVMIMLSRGVRAVSPFVVPKGMPNAVSSTVAIAMGAKGPALTSTLACASGNYALVEAAHYLKRGEVDVVLAGGTESVMSAVYLAALHRMGALSQRNDNPTEASRPFDADRDGFVFGEGAAVMVLESEEHALRRGAPIYARFLGGRMTGDAYHVTAPDPDGDGAMRAMSCALDSAGLAPDDVDVIFAHGTSTPLNDVTETKAIKRVFGQRAYRLAVTATKSMIGHTMGAAGAIATVAAICGMRDGVLPPTINYSTPDPDCDLDYVPNEARLQAYESAMINAFGFGGHNATVLVGRYGDS